MRRRCTATWWCHQHRAARFSGEWSPPWDLGTMWCTSRRYVEVHPSMVQPSSRASTARRSAGRMPVAAPWWTMSGPCAVMASVRPTHPMRSTTSGPTLAPASTAVPCSKPDASARGWWATTMRRGSRRLRADRIRSAVVLAGLGLRSSSSWHRVVSANALRSPGSGRASPAGISFSPLRSRPWRHISASRAPSCPFSRTWLPFREGWNATYWPSNTRRSSARLILRWAWRIRLTDSRSISRLRAITSAEAPASARRVSSSTRT